MADVFRVEFVTADELSAVEDFIFASSDDFTEETENKDGKENVEQEEMDGDDMKIETLVVESGEPKAPTLDELASSDYIRDRQLAAQSIVEHLRQAGSNKEALHSVISIMCKLGDDEDFMVRSELMQNISPIALFCKDHSEDLGVVIRQQLVPYTVKMLTDDQIMIRKIGHTALQVLLEHGVLDNSQLSDWICPLLSQLVTSGGAAEDIRSEDMSVICKMFPFIGKEITEKFFLEPFISLCCDSAYTIRKVCAFNFDCLCEVVGTETTESTLLPAFLNLCNDEIWEIRKECAQVFVSVARTVTYKTRREILPHIFINLLNDESRFVKLSAYASLGEFISTFANTSETDLLMELPVENYEESTNNNQWIGNTDNNSGNEINDNVQNDSEVPAINFEHSINTSLQLERNKVENIMYQSQSTNASNLDNGSEAPCIKFEHSINANFLLEKNKVKNISKETNASNLDLNSCENLNLETPEWKNTNMKESKVSNINIIQSDLTNVNVEHGKISCSELDEKSMSLNHFRSRLDSQCFEKLRTAVINRGDPFGQYSCDLINESPETCKVQNTTISQRQASSQLTLSTASDAHVYLNNENIFNSFQFWRTPLPEVRLDFDIEESIGKSRVLKEDYCRKALDFNIEPSIGKRHVLKEDYHRKARVTENLREIKFSFKDSILESEEDNNSVFHRSGSVKIFGKRVKQELSPYEQDIVPPELLAKFKFAVEHSAENGELFAYSFPAVAYTLGKRYWNCIRTLCTILSFSLKFTVRRKVASFLHELASFLGHDIVAEDLLPIFLELMTDIDAVRVKIMENVSVFLRQLEPHERKKFLFVIKGLAKVDQGPDWRFRYTIVKELIPCVSLFESSEVESHFQPIAVHLLTDKVSDVRKFAIKLFAEILKSLMTVSNTNSELLYPIFWYHGSKNWRFRQIYVFICEELAIVGSLPANIYVNEIVPNLFHLAWDTVPNVRLAFARCLSRTLLPLGYLESIQKTQNELLLRVLYSLQNDADRDVKHFAQLCAGILNVLPQKKLSPV